LAEQPLIEQSFSVETRSLTLKRCERVLFERMSWQLPRGKFLAVTGASGAGKSSLLSCLANAIPPASGDFNFAADSDSVGIVFQNFRLTANLSVLTNVLCGRLGAYKWYQTLFSFPQKEREQAFRSLCELGLEKLVHRQVRQLSGGEQQRTAVARALLQNPSVILADEPTSNLDDKLARRVLSLLRRHCDDKKGAVIAVLHNEQLVSEFADCVLNISSEHENGWSFQCVNR
jgi:phosphonate transport system ATP-binding protein